jgi:hypothetical protein
LGIAVGAVGTAGQRFKVKYKLMPTDTVYDKETLIASHLDRERQASHQPIHVAQLMPTTTTNPRPLDFG